MIWLLSTPNHFGELGTWVHENDREVLYSTVLDLFLHSELHDKWKEIDELFTKTVLRFLGDENFVLSLRKTPWKSIYTVAKQHKLNSAMNFFSNFEVIKSKFKDDVVLMKILHAME